MISVIKNNYSEIFKKLNDPLYKNSFYLILSSIFNAFLGFIFWFLVAKIYPESAVGLGTSLISVMSLISLLSLLGFDQSTIRCFPRYNKNKVYGTSIIIIIFSATIIGIIYMAGVNFWSPALEIVKSYPFIFLAFLISNAMATYNGYSLIALRKAKYYFIENIFLGSRIFFIFIFTSLGAIGIYMSVGLAYFIAFILSILIIYMFGVKPTVIDKAYLKSSFHFSIGTYLSSILILLPTYILPILILNVLGSENAAFYYISYTIASALFFISSAFSTSLFVEGSHGENLKIKSYKSLLSVSSLLVPAIVLVYLFGGNILSLIGKNYVNGYNLLVLMSLSSFFILICQNFISIKKVQKDIKVMIIFSSLLSISLLLLSYIFMIYYGITGIGYAWILGYGLSSLVVLVILKREGWI